MEFYRIDINESEIEFSDAELEELADLIEYALEHLEEYNEMNKLKEHSPSYYIHIARRMREYARYE